MITPGHLRRCVSQGLTALLLSGVLSGCVNSSDGNANVNSNPSGNSSGRTSDLRRTFSLDALPTAQIAIDGQTIDVWLADTPQTRQEGLMFVPADELGDAQGMLFVFPTEQELGFWMLNTITPLDIAYARFNGTIVRTHQMSVATNFADQLRTYPSGEPAIFALEMKQGAFDRLGITEGDQLNIPASVFTNVR